jgi:hypothetical protein
VALYRLVADYAQHHDSGVALGGHHNRDLTDVGAKPPTVLPSSLFSPSGPVKISSHLGEDELDFSSQICQLVDH